MTITQTKTKSPAPDERVAKRSPFQKLLGRPEVGALVGAIVLFIFFALVSPTFTQPGALATILYGSSTIGIMAVGVSLLMIGGEFDLSTGVAVITSALTASLFSWYFTTNVWVGVGLALVVSLSVGFINGWILIKTKLPSFIVTLATFLMLTGLNLGLTKLIAFSIPVLTAIYPPCIVLVALSFCKDFWQEQGRIVGPVMLVSFIFGCIDALKGAGLAGWMPSQLANLPLSEQGLAWLVPSVMTLVVAFGVDRMLGKRSEAIA